MVNVLHDISQTHEVGDIRLEMLDALVSVGFVQRRIKHELNRTDQQAGADHNINELKKHFVSILKNKFSGSNELWDILINLESVTDRNGLIWFMSQVIEKTAVGDRAEYETVLKTLLEMEDE